MKTILTILLVSMEVFAQTSFQTFSWLTGCWSGDMKNGKYEECWTAPSAEFMQGSGRMIGENKKVRMREHMTIEKGGEDFVMYVLGYGENLKPEEQGAIPFKLVKFSASELIFENPKHDYPQRITYTKKPDGNLSARIELLYGKSPVTFPLNNLSKKK